MLGPGPIKYMCSLSIFIKILKYFNVTCLPLFTPIRLTNKSLQQYNWTYCAYFLLLLLDLLRVTYQKQYLNLSSNQPNPLDHIPSSMEVKKHGMTLSILLVLFVHCSHRSHQFKLGQLILLFTVQPFQNGLSCRCLANTVKFFLTKNGSAFDQSYEHSICLRR